MNMEKSPEELGKLFEVLDNQIGEKIAVLPALKLRLESTYRAYQKELIDNVDLENLINKLDVADEPVGFVRYRDLAREKLEKEIESLKEQRKKLDDRCQIEITEEMAHVKERVRLLPVKIPELIDRYNILEQILSPEGFVTKTFNSLEKYNNSMITKNFKKEFWDKSRTTTVKFGKFVYDLQIAWKNAWETTTEIEFNKCISDFDVLIANLKRFENIDNMINTCSDILDVDSNQIQDLYNRILKYNTEIDNIAGTVSSSKEIERLVRLEKNKMVELNNEQKRLRLKIMEIDSPISTLENGFNKKMHVSEVFWKYIEYEYDDFSDEIKNQLLFNNYQNWFDARKKYEIYLKIEQILNAHQIMFNSLTDAYDQSMSNLKQAKRNHSRYKDRSSQIALDKCTLHPVDITEDDNENIAKLYILCENLNKISEYIDDTNLFYDENVELITSMYRNIKYIMDMWTKIFSKLIGK